MIRAERQESGALVWAAGLFALALALRLVHLATIRDSPFFSILYIDPLFFDEWGQRIAAGKWLSDRPFFLDPLYPYFLGAVYALVGHHYEPVAAIQGLLGAPDVAQDTQLLGRLRDPRQSRLLLVPYGPSLHWDTS